MARDGFQQHVHVFRALAITMVVCTHTIPHHDWQGSGYASETINMLVNEASVLFVFIAGYLFQHLMPRYEYGKYLKQKLKTIILPYLILSVPALYISIVYHTQAGDVHPWVYSMPEWKQTIYFLLTGKHLAPLWFVPTISLYYLASPLLVRLDRQAPSLYWSIIPLVILSVLIGRNGTYGPINKALYLLPAYLSGMFCSHYSQQVLDVARRYIWPLCGAVLVLLVLTVMHKISPLFGYERLDLQILMKLTMAPVIMYLLFRAKEPIGHRFDFVAEVSFGVFFIHAYWIGVLRIAYAYASTGKLNLAGGSLLPGNLLMLAASLTIVMLLSLGSVWIGRKILGSRSRYVLGA